MKITNDGSKEDVRKRFLVMTLKDCHSLHLEDDAYNYVGVSKFLLPQT